MKNVDIRYEIHLKCGEKMVIHSDNTEIETVFNQSNNGNSFFCLPGRIISKDQVKYIEVKAINRDLIIEEKYEKGGE